MKTVFIGDIHGRDIWKDIIKHESPGRVVFIGDYFDSFNKELTAAVQMYNFKDIIAFKESAGVDVILLFGNHDYHYYPNFETYTGFQHGAAVAIRLLIEENKRHLQMCYQMDNILCSHAGIGYNWLVEQNGYTEGNIAELVNDIWNSQPARFRFRGLDPYGDSVTQTPIWIRPRSLMSGNKDTFLKTDYIQIVGHTRVNSSIDIKGKSTGGRYYFIDALDVNEYLVFENNEFRTGVVKN